MLHDTLPYKDALIDFFARAIPGHSIVLTPSNWDCVEIYMDLLALFNNVTKLLSGTYYSTSCLVLTSCVTIAIAFRSCAERADIDNVLASALLETRQHWLKYFFNIPSIFLVANLLDPRFQVDGLQEQLTIYYENLFADVFEKDDTVTVPNPDVITMQARSDLVNLYTEYKQSQPSDPTQGTSSAENIPTHSSSSSKGKSQLAGGLFKGSSHLSSFYNLLDTRSKRARSNNPNYEIDSYLGTAFDGAVDSEEFDIFDWWSRRASIFPTLSRIAKEVFACPASTVAVERAFSLGGLTLEPRRATMTAEHVEHQCLLNDWVNARNRTQQHSSSSTDDFVIDTETETEAETDAE